MSKTICIFEQAVPDYCLPADVPKTDKKTKGTLPFVSGVTTMAATRM
jgi:hypothetical protein